MLHTQSSWIYGLSFANSADWRHWIKAFHFTTCDHGIALLIFLHQTQTNSAYLSKQLADIVEKVHIGTYIINGVFLFASSFCTCCNKCMAGRIHVQATFVFSELHVVNCHKKVQSHVAKYNTSWKSASGYSNFFLLKLSTIGLSSYNIVQHIQSNNFPCA